MLGLGDISCSYYDPYIPYLEEYKPSEGYIARRTSLFNVKVNKVLNVKFTISLVKYNYDENSKYIDYTETETSEITFEKESGL